MSNRRFELTRIDGLAGALLGAAFFVAIYGTWILDPTNIQWLLHGDPAQHYLGFAFYRNAPWSWPLGAIPQFGAPLGTTLVFTDAIPLLAIPFKLFDSLLPLDFQYLGAWMLACYVLQGVFAERVLLRLGLSRLPAVLGAMLLLSSPALAMRAYGHESLMAHWLLLAAFEAFLARRPHWLAPLWTLGALIHAYWIALLAPFVLLGWLRRREGWKLGWSLGWGHRLGWVAGMGLAMAAAGYFTARPSQLAAVGYGQYSANLLALIDPMDWQGFLKHFGRSTEGAGEWSRLLPAQAHAQPDQYEGFVYLGAGALLLISVALLAFVARIRRSIALASRSQSAKPRSANSAQLWPLMAVALLMFCYSASIRVTLGPRVLFDPQLPDWLRSTLGVFRATGRFAWPAALLLPTWACAKLSRSLSTRTVLLVLVVTVAVQVWDLSDKWGEFGRRFVPGGAGSEVNYAEPAWLAASQMQHLVVLPLNAADDWIKPALFAARNRQSINLGLISRVDEDARSQAEATAIGALLAAHPHPGTAYWIRDPSVQARLPAELYRSMRALPLAPGVMLIPR